MWVRPPLPSAFGFFSFNYTPAEAASFLIGYDGAGLEMKAWNEIF
jgi:hypothetical protein